MDNKYLANGTYGNVFSVNNDEVNKITSIFSENYKELNQSNLQECVFYKTFAKHKNICEVKNISIEKNNYVITLQKYPYTLETFVRTVNLKSRLLCFKKIFFQLVDVLYHLNKYGLIHGDVKPQNILLDKNLNVKLCDFGSIISFRLISSYFSLCTPEYAPIELLFIEYIDNYHIDSKSDVWSLGLTCYYYFSGFAYLESESYKPKKITEKTIQKLTNEYKMIDWNSIDLTSLNSYEITMLHTMSISHNVDLSNITVLNTDCLRLMSKMLYFHPDVRMDITELWNDAYFYDCKKDDLNINLEISFNKKYSALYCENKHFRHNVVDFVFKLCEDMHVLNCFVLTIRLLDKYYCELRVRMEKERIRQGHVAYEVAELEKIEHDVYCICTAMVIIVSNLIDNYPVIFDNVTYFFEKISPDKSKTNELIMEYIKHILITLDFQMYYETFDWILIKRGYRINYSQIFCIIDNIWTFDENNEFFIKEYFEPYAHN